MEGRLHNCCENLNFATVPKYRKPKTNNKRSKHSVLIYNDSVSDLASISTDITACGSLIYSSRKIFCHQRKRCVNSESTTVHGFYIFRISRHVISFDTMESEICLVTNGLCEEQYQTKVANDRETVEKGNGEKKNVVSITSNTSNNGRKIMR